MNRATIASLEQQARALGAAGVHVLVDGHTLVDVGDTSRPVRVHSVRKSLISALYGVAYDQGVVNLGATLGEVGIDDTPALTEQEKSATIEDLLTARSGVYLPAPEGGTSFLPPRGAYAPGTHWVYNNWDFNVLGNIYERLTHKSLYIAFDHYFAQPLGFTDWQPFTNSSYEYRADPMGGDLRYPNYTFFLSARDLARFGELFVNRGVRAGARLLSQEWIALSTRLVSTTGAGDSLFGGYGFLWWIAGPEQDLTAAGIPAGTYSANGMGGNFLTILPGLRAVVAVTAGPGVEESNPQPPDNTSSTVTGYPRFVGYLVDALRS
jgi:CubicO group peptidase (beta-lactamase class C family)